MRQCRSSRYAVAFYVAAKVTEAKDKQIFVATGGRLSGHSVKHLLAGVSCLLVGGILLRRELA